MADGAPAEIITEAVNLPVVMSPWEIERNVATLLEDARECAPAGAVDGLATALGAFRHAWRERWAVHGASSTGWEGYRRLLAEADAEVRRGADGLRLANGLALDEAIRQLVLHPALAPASLHEASGARPGGRGRNVSADAPARIERPVFVVSPPRSGSSLLFETLARAPGVFTIGGESHRVIEQVPSLHPSARGWESNRLTADDASPEVVAALRRAFVAELRDRAGAQPPATAVRLLEKTPKNALRVPFLAAAFPDATFVSLYRDPRETLSSMLDAWRSRQFVTYPDLPGWTGPPWSLLLTPA